MSILKYFGFKRQCMECGNDALPGHDCKGESRVLTRRSFFFLAAAAPIVIASAKQIAFVTQGSITVAEIEATLDFIWANYKVAPDSIWILEENLAPLRRVLEPT